MSAGFAPGMIKQGLLTRAVVLGVVLGFGNLALPTAAAQETLLWENASVRIGPRDMGTVQAADQGSADNMCATLSKPEIQYYVDSQGSNVQSRFEAERTSLPNPLTTASYRCRVWIWW
jgi:hypothetical protein